MADVLIGTTVTNGYAASFRPLVWASKTVGYFFRLHVSNGDLVYKKTTDGGATWGSDVTVTTTTTISKHSIWPDWWTDSTGTLIYIAYITNGIVGFKTLDISSDTLSTEVNIQSLVGSASGQLYGTHAILDIVKARGGNLYVVYNHLEGAFRTSGFERSTDGGTTWTARTSPFESEIPDKIILQPGDAADDDDILAIFWDKSAGDLDRKLYDNSANSWATTNISTSVTDGFDQAHMMAATHRKSDNHSMVIIQNDIQNACQDLKVFDIASGSITAKTDVWSNEDNHMATSIVIDQNNDDLYAIFIGDPCETEFSTVNVYYSKSTNGGTSWATKVQVNEACANDFREVWVDPSVGDVRAGLIAVAWADRIVSASELFVSAVNAIVISGVPRVELGGQTTYKLIMAGVL